MTVASVEFSAVIPCLNEAENVANIAAAVGRELSLFGADHEIIFIDNGSTDGTVDIVKGLCAGEPRIRLIVNNQNYGQMRSPTWGIYQASGRAIIGISADFQDPPELIPQFIERWRAGSKVVLGVRRSENTTAWLRFIRRVGYDFFSRFGDYRVIPNATGFGLYDREVVDTLRKWRDPEPFFRGMLVESGFGIDLIEYHRPERAGGVTKNNIWTLISFALSGLASSSRRLLRLPLALSMIVFGLAALVFCVAVVSAVLAHGFWPMALVSGGLFAFAVVLFFLGLIGDQVRLMSQMLREVPLVVEKERVNFPSPAP